MRFPNRNPSPACRRPLNPWIATAPLITLTAAAVAAAGGGSTKVDFSRDVYPILKRSCFECHGPAQQAGGLRLDTRQGMFDGRRPVVAPGKPEASELFRRISLPKGKPGVMPARGEVLPAGQVAALREWIRQGAIWPETLATAKHWAYVPPQRAPLPKVSNEKWCRSPIDYFILARLDKEGLRPSPEADRATLLRRVSLDLTGLPPSPAEVEAFLADSSPEAYERVVDRLLASPDFGPRWARPWLDLARYADSHGFQRDDLRDIWSYRDWVIEALNADMPFDQFTIEQLAGDLLVRGNGINEVSGATTSTNSSSPSSSSSHLPLELQRKLIATGFHRNAPTNVEAGSEPEETRTNQVIDRVNTTAAVWLGTTLECAQCHDHKYDPFSQKDYYRLFAFFNSTAIEADRSDPKVPGSIRFLGPSLTLSNPEQEAQRARLQAEIKSLDERLVQRGRELTADGSWEASLAELAKKAQQEHPLEVATFDSLEGAAHRVLPDRSVLLIDDAPDRDTYTITVRAAVPGITGFKLEALTDPSLPGMGPGRGDARRPNFVLNTFAVARVRAGEESPGQPVRLRDARADFSQPNYLVAGAIDTDPKTAWAINPRFHQPHWATFATEAPVSLAEGEVLRFTLVQNYGGARTIGRLRLSALTGEPGAGALPPAVAAALRVSHEKRNAVQVRALTEFALAGDASAKRLRDQRARLEGELKALRPATTLVMQELPEPRKSTLFERGSYTSPGEAVSPGTPAVLPPLSGGSTNPTRLDLARWLVSPENPLTARVTVNRWWAEIFGHGIVTTLEDFGIKGEPPTHPELLDWLACCFAAEAGNRTSSEPGARNAEAGLGWSLKRLLRLIVTSATYRQSARVTPELLRRDDRNLLYARGPRFRMDAEMIRDNALAAAGLLSRKHGGPPVRPYQPDGLWTKIGGEKVDYVVSPGEDRYRRGVYVVWKRAAPYPSFVNFDASARLACTVKRHRSNTPLQALTLLNDPVYVEAAQALAKRVLTESKGDPDARITYAFRCCLAREPRLHERQVLRRLYEAQLDAYRSDPMAAVEAVGAFPRPATVSPEEFAAWQAVTTALLNLDETITK